MNCNNISVWGVIQLYFILLRAQQENLGCSDINFTRMGWLERVQSELTEIIPDLEVRELQRKIEGGHRIERGKETSEPSGMERETAQAWTAASAILVGNLEACWWEGLSYLPCVQPALKEWLENNCLNFPLHICLRCTCWKHQARGKKRGTDKSWRQRSSSRDTTSTGMR